MTGELVGTKLGILETTAGLRVRHQRRDIARAMHDAHDLNAAGDLAVQDQIPPHRKVAQARAMSGRAGPRED